MEDIINTLLRIEEMALRSPNYDYDNTLGLIADNARNLIFKLQQ